MKTLSWIIAVAGVALTALPLCAELFTKKTSPSEPPIRVSSETESAIYTTESFSMVHVPSWVPLIGGLMALCGGVGIKHKKDQIKNDNPPKDVI